MVTGIDLVKQQIRIAAGEPLPFRQEDIVHRGVAFECRINSEDPARLPPLARHDHALAGPGRPRRAAGLARRGRLPRAAQLRLAGGKLIVHQPTRAEALASMRRALGEFVVEGISTTIPIHQDIMNHPAFIAGKVDTTFIERTWMQK